MSTTIPLDRHADSTERRKWQIEQTRAALREADAGDFAADEEVAALARKWEASGAGDAP
jgi:predicted transcriptional regulator